VRLAKFSFVGAIGIGVQLLVLALLTRLKVNYLLATFLAVEAAVMHNFVWHQRFTWIDRDLSRSSALGRLLRFHVSNGLISFVGNLSVMRFLVGSFRVPVLLANGIAIAVCALVNFLVGDQWVFSEQSGLCVPSCPLWLGFRKDRLGNHNSRDRSRISTNERCANGR
jgi:putative flippase GtrA